MILERFQPAHLEQMQMQTWQARTWLQHGTRTYAAALARELSYTWHHHGRIVLCCGVLEHDADTGQLWSFLSVDAPMIPIHRAALRFIDICGKRVLQATSECNWGNGCRWLRMLGFKPAERLPGYGPDGADHQLFVRGL